MENEMLATKTISVTNFRKSFGTVTRALPNLEFITLTKGGEPFATLTLAPELKRKRLLRSFGVWKNTKLDNDSFWSETTKKHSRKGDVSL